MRNETIATSIISECKLSSAKRIVITYLTENKKLNLFNNQMKNEKNVPRSTYN